MPPTLKIGPSGHWYTKDGVAHHQVKMLKPNAKGETHRNTSLTDARKLGLLPSVTNIIGMLANEGLTKWKNEQLILACMRLRQGYRETDEDFMNRVYRESKREVDEARKFGNVMHAAIDKFAASAKPGAYGWEGDRPQETEFIWPWWGLFEEWWNENVDEVLAVEKVVVGDGYAGCLDAKIKHRTHGVCIMDWKTRKKSNSPTIKEPDRKKFEAYPSDGLQLAAYRSADYRNPLEGVNADNCISVFINSEEPEKPQAHVWDEEEIINYDAEFEHLVQAWQIRRNYTP